MINATHIFAGACQYLVGNYLNTELHRPILEAMLGKEYTMEDVERLNQMMPQQLEKYHGSHSVVHLLYSKHEHTYQSHTIHLIADLKKYGIYYTEQIEQFEKHGEVGTYFIPYIKKELKKLT